MLVLDLATILLTCFILWTITNIYNARIRLGHHIVDLLYSVDYHKYMQC